MDFISVANKVVPVVKLPAFILLPSRPLHDTSGTLFGKILQKASIGLVQNGVFLKHCLVVFFAILSDKPFFEFPFLGRNFSFNFVFGHFI